MTRSMLGRSRPRDATSVQRRREGWGERRKEFRVEVRRGWVREPLSLWRWGCWVVGREERRSENVDVGVVVVVVVLVGGRASAAGVVAVSLSEDMGGVRPKTS